MLVDFLSLVQFPFTPGRGSRRMPAPDTCLARHSNIAQLADAAAHRISPAAPAADPRSLYLQGLLLLRAGVASQAAELLACAAAARPAHEGARVNLVRALLAAGQPQRTLDAAGRRVDRPARPCRTALRPRHRAERTRPAARGTGGAAARPWRSDRARAAHLNLGNACADLDDLEGAERHIRAALALDPALVEAHASLGFVLTSRGRLADAIAACDAAIALRPDFVQAHWNLASAALLAGDFARGFAEYEWRKRHDRFRRDFVDLPGPVWTGDDPAGRTILVHAEQGLRRHHPVRPLPAVDRGARRPGGARLRTRRCCRCSARCRACRGGEGRRAAALRCLDRPDEPAAACSPRAPATIPSAGRLPARRSGPRRALAGAAARAGARSVVAWAGNPAHSNDRRRSLPPDAVARLVAAPGSRSTFRLDRAAAETGLPDLSPLLTDYAETAALIANLDLVVTVDTSVAHVAGALGVPCWVMLPFAPDWRWMLGRDDTPWYASLRLFRQPAPGDWDAVIDAVAAALDQDDRNAPHQ